MKSLKKKLKKLSNGDKFIYCIAPLSLKCYYNDDAEDKEHRYKFDEEVTVDFKFGDEFELDCDEPIIDNELIRGFYTNDNDEHFYCVFKGDDLSKFFDSFAKHEKYDLLCYRKELFEQISSHYPNKIVKMKKYGVELYHTDEIKSYFEITIKMRIFDIKYDVNSPVFPTEIEEIEVPIKYTSPFCKKGSNKLIDFVGDYINENYDSDIYASIRKIGYTGI